MRADRGPRGAGGVPRPDPAAVTAEGPAPGRVSSDRPVNVTRVTASVDARCERSGRVPRRWPLASKVSDGFAVVLGALAFVVVRGYQDRVEAAPRRGTTRGHRDGRHRSRSGNHVVRRDAPRVDRSRGVRATRRHTRRRDGRRAASSTADVDGGEVLTRRGWPATTVGPVAALVPDGLRAWSSPSGLPAGTSVRATGSMCCATYGGGRPHTELVATGLEVVRVLAGDASTGAGVGGTRRAIPAWRWCSLVDRDTAARLAYAQRVRAAQIAIIGPRPRRPPDTGTTHPGSMFRQGRPLA